jgi:hypothetical protein
LKAGGEVSFHSFSQGAFNAWKREIARQHTKPGWNLHDESIQRTVRSYARFHAGKSGYIGPPWQLIKAMIWTEGGGPGFGDEWRLRPMQIGVVIRGKQDPGIFDVIKPSTAIVVPPDIFRGFSVDGIRTNAEANIQAGLALLHLKLASFSHRPTSTTSAAAIPAKHQGKLNNPSSVLSTATQTATSLETTPSPLSKSHLPQRKTERYISAWAPFCPVILYQRYNIGDAAYASKIEYCLSLIHQGNNE